MFNTKMKSRSIVALLGALVASCSLAPAALGYGVTASATGTWTGSGGAAALAQIEVQRVGNSVVVLCSAEGNGSIYTEITCDGLSGAQDGSAAAISYVKGWNGDSSLQVCYSVRVLHPFPNRYTGGSDCAQIRLAF